MAEYSGILDEALYQSYVNTHYKVLKPEFTIKIGELNPQLDEFLVDNNAYYYTFITAANPFSQMKTPDENSEKMMELESIIMALQRTYLKGQGVDPTGKWPPENSFFVLHLSLSQSITLAKKFEQNAIVVRSIGAKAELEVCV